MSGGGGKGGSQTTSVTIPRWLQEPSERAIERGENIARIGYTPYMGPEVAAFSPDQMAAFGNNNAAANAFGMQGGGFGLPEPETFAGGLQGYSSMPLYNETMDNFATARPGQYDFINSFFIDPTMGGMPGAVPANGGVGAPRYGTSTSTGNPDDGGNFNQGSWGNRTSGGSIGGYNGLGDMVDGGGPGQSGPTFQGGGLISTVGNTVASPVSRDNSGGGFGGGK